MSEMKLSGIENRVALVTGGGRGIGRCVAETLMRQGASAAVGDLRRPEVHGALGVQMDVTDERSVDDAVNHVEGELGPVDLLVCNAGIYRSETLVQTSRTSWDESV